jgi:hypothetical protein
MSMIIKTASRLLHAFDARRRIAHDARRIMQCVAHDARTTITTRRLRLDDLRRLINNAARARGASAPRRAHQSSLTMIAC